MNALKMCAPLRIPSTLVVYFLSSYRTLNHWKQNEKQDPQMGEETFLKERGCKSVRMGNGNKQSSAGSKCRPISRCIREDRHKLCMFSSKLWLFRKIIIPTKEDIYQHKCLLIIKYGENFRLPNKSVSLRNIPFFFFRNPEKCDAETSNINVSSESAFNLSVSSVNFTSLTTGKQGTKCEISIITVENYIISISIIITNSLSPFSFPT